MTTASTGNSRYPNAKSLSDFPPQFKLSFEAAQNSEPVYALCSCCQSEMAAVEATEGKSGYDAAGSCCPSASPEPPPSPEKCNSPSGRLSISGGNVIRLDTYLPSMSDRSEEVNRGFQAGRVQSARSRQSSARGRQEVGADKGHSGKGVRAPERASWPVPRRPPQASTSPERDSILQQRMAQLSSQQSFSGNRKFHLEDTFRVSPIQKQRLNKSPGTFESAAYSLTRHGAPGRRGMQGSHSSPPSVPSIRLCASGRSRQ